MNTDECDVRELERRIEVLSGVADGWQGGATAMRDLCVDAIKSLRATPHGAAYGNAINDAIRQIESITIDQVKEKQS